jgi:hypothetical protein
VNGSTASEGRVEICYAGIWGSVCDKGWNNQDAAIVCMQLGFQGTSILYKNCNNQHYIVHNRLDAIALRGSYFGNGVGPYHLSSVECSGEERTLLQCSHSVIGYHHCRPGRDAGVRCDGNNHTHLGSSSLHNMKLSNSFSMYSPRPSSVPCQQ